jgi:glucose/arabinose dehydrogenase
VAVRSVLRRARLVGMMLFGVEAMGACAEHPLRPSPTLALSLVASGLGSALYLTAPTGDTVRAFVVQQTGTIRVLRRDTLLATPFLELSAIIGCCGERGLLSMAFHPSYASNGWFYVDYTDRNGTLTIARYHVSADPNIADPATAEILLAIPHSTYANHNGGLVTFGLDGYLYIGTGDGGGGGDPFGNGQDSTTLLGKILRIDVDGTVPYAIPPTNPFVGRAPAAPEVWAYGLRNPWRFSFDRATRDFYVADVGQNEWEEVDFAPAGDPGGHNYGWNRMEGLHCYSPASGCVTSGLVPPIYEYSHGPNNSLGCSVIGGYVYRGTRHPGLGGRYFFAELCAGWVRSLKMQGGVATDVVDHTAEFGLVPGVTSFGEDGRGELYMTLGSGEVYRITPQ